MASRFFPVTSGSKGMQLYAALGGTSPRPSARPRAATGAGDDEEVPRVGALEDDQVTRPDKVFFDWSQNVAAKTTISPYSSRGRELPVRSPRTWDEVEVGAPRGGGIEQVMIDDMLERIGPGASTRRTTPRRPP